MVICNTGKSQDIYNIDVTVICQFRQISRLLYSQYP
jgi:hypothetical protein